MEGCLFLIAVVQQCSCPVIHFVDEHMILVHGNAFLMWTHMGLHHNYIIFFNVYLVCNFLVQKLPFSKHLASRGH